MTKSTTPKKKQSTENLNSSRTARIFMALYIVLLLLLQLFTFDKFPDLLAKLGVSSGWAVLLIILELLSLPFLLDMKLPVVYRKISMWINRFTNHSIKKETRLLSSRRNQTRRNYAKRHFQRTNF